MLTENRVCIFSLLRLIEFRKFVVTDLASSSALESIWTVLEINVAIITGCLPLMKSLFQGVLGRMWSGATKRSYPSSGRNYPSGMPDGLNKFFDPRHTDHSTSVKGANETLQLQEHDEEHAWRHSDVELNRIAITMAVDQDVENRSDAGSAEAVSNRNWLL